MIKTKQQILYLEELINFSQKLKKYKPVIFYGTLLGIERENNIIKNAVILLQGYGGDGEDISMLTLNWKRFLPNTIFLSPNGHEKCNINPNGDFELIYFSYIVYQLSF